MIHLSLKYVNKNYKSICKISKWINFELIKCIISEEKIARSLINGDFEVIDRLIKFEQTITFELLIKKYGFVQKMINGDLRHSITRNGSYWISKIKIRTNEYNYDLIYHPYTSCKSIIICSLKI